MGVGLTPHKNNQIGKGEKQMAEITKKSLVLTFSTAGNKEVNLTIPSPKEDLEGSQIKSAMDSIVTSGIFGEDDTVVGIVGAKYVVQQEEAVTLA